MTICLSQSELKPTNHRSIADMSLPEGALGASALAAGVGAAVFAVSFALVVGLRYWFCYFARGKTAEYEIVWVRCCRLRIISGGTVVAFGCGCAAFLLLAPAAVPTTSSESSHVSYFY